MFLQCTAPTPRTGRYTAVNAMYSCTFYCAVYVTHAYRMQTVGCVAMGPRRKSLLFLR